MVRGGWGGGAKPLLSAPRPRIRRTTCESWTTHAPPREILAQAKENEKKLKSMEAKMISRRRWAGCSAPSDQQVAAQSLRSPTLGHGEGFEKWASSRHGQA